MAGRISDDAIRDIRERANLAEVVSEVVALKRRGRSTVGLCPFHAEKSPSFTVSEERGFYHCFGCGEHGDVFSFVMKTQSLPFPEAVRWVAQRFGLAVPEEVAGSARKSEPLVAVTAAANDWFRGMLRGPEGQRARTYLAERGILPETIERFGLGWAPAVGDALARHLRQQGHGMDDAVTVGLVGRRQSGGFYDRFRERVIFPIADAQGRVVAFGGRILPGAAPVGGDAPPKYLNSPESPLFHKGRTVYGLGLAREAIRQHGRVVVVEGYVDVIALAQAGVAEAVAPLGTALTADQLRVLRRFSERVIACFDGDEAGRRAAARSFPTFLEAGLWGRGVFLPAGDDPDTFVRAHGRAAFVALLEKPEPLVDAYVRQLAGPDADSIRRRADGAREVGKLLRKLSDVNERDPLARLAAQYLGIREEELRAQLDPTTAAPARAAAPARREADRAMVAEEQLVELLYADPALGPRLREVVADFEQPVARRAVERLLAEGDDADRTALVQDLPRTLRDRVVQRLLDDAADENRDRIFADCVAAIRERSRRRERGRLLEELRAAEARGDALAAAAAQRALTQHLTEKIRT